uniref:Putative secreted protein n=1 Tax=Ixodes scapularis TaxID=6945 RepID=A0A4D5S0G5_IXOSC
MAGAAVLGAAGGTLTAGLGPVTGAGQATRLEGRGPTVDRGPTPAHHTWVTTARPRAGTTPPMRSWTKAATGQGARPQSDCTDLTTKHVHILITRLVSFFFFLSFCLF